MFGDERLRGNWLPGMPNSYRRPHKTYNPIWDMHITQIPWKYDIVVWNLGHHFCPTSEYLSNIHTRIQQNISKRVIFFQTVGVNPCSSLPQNAEIFYTDMFKTEDHFWDNHTHLKGMENLKLVKKFNRFLQQYVSSNLELEWFRHNSVKGKICSISQKLQNEYKNTKMSYYKNMDGSREYIEPLSGIGRHPRAKVGCRLNNEVSIFDTSYINPLYTCNKHKDLFGKRFLFYDLGCSVYDENMGGGLLSSIPQILKMYSKSCIKFDHIYGWEAIPMPHWWSAVPPNMSHKITFKNIPVTASEFRKVLHKTARSQDFVIVKLDVDNTKVELEIIDVIRKSGLVDELFFEYHYYFDGMDFGWNTTVDDGNNVDSALKLMRDMREFGIRSHFWV
jgi:hypothetical protein